MSTFLLLMLLHKPSIVLLPLQSSLASGLAPNDVSTLVDQVAQSGRVLSITKSLDDHIRIAPGTPPILAFRYLDGRQRGRFGGFDLVLDDAGH